MNTYYPALRYPETPRTNIVETLHGVEVPDPYRFMEDIDAPEVQRWVEAQSAFTAEYLSKLDGREDLARRMTELWNFEKFTPPFKRGGRYFFTRNDGLQNQNVLYWMDASDAEPQVLLDPNTLSEDGTIALTGFTVSPDGKLVAYGLSASGSDWQEWRVRRVDGAADLGDRLQWLKFTEAAWTPDNAGFYYSRYDAPEEGLTYKGPNYNQKLYYHRLGEPQEGDALIYERPDQKEWGFGGVVTEDGRYLIISVWKGTHRENGVFYQDLQTGGEVVELLPDFDASYSFVHNDDSRFYFLTDHNAPLSRVIAIDIQNAQPQNWIEIIPEGRDSVESVHRVGGKFVAHMLHDAHSQVQVYDHQGQLLRQVKLPGIGTVLGFYGEPDDPETFFHFSGFTTPGEVYQYNVDTDEITLFRKPDLRFAPQDYETKQVFYQSKDGTQVPMFIVHKKGLALNGDNPTYLYGYGGFSIAITPAFAVPVLVWMEMGGVYALANLRGGSEYGKDWHQGGALHNKQNVFDDFIAAGEWLIASKYTRPARLGISGRSNGGLLTGAAITQRPDLFGAALVTVGVLDMLRYHKFTIGWAWVSDYGSPDEPDYFKTLLAYSPYHNIHAGTTYPPTLISTGDHDDRVYPAHSFKFAAALQHAQAGPNPVLIRIDLKTGHGVGKPTAKLIEEFADQMAFVHHHLGQKDEAQ